MSNPKFEASFWNEANEIVKVAGKYFHYFATYDEAYRGVDKFLELAANAGAVEVTISKEDSDDMDCFVIERR